MPADPSHTPNPLTALSTRIRAMMRVVPPAPLVTGQAREGTDADTRVDREVQAILSRSGSVAEHVQAYHEICENHDREGQASSASPTRHGWRVALVVLCLLGSAVGYLPQVQPWLLQAFMPLAQLLGVPSLQLWLGVVVGLTVLALGVSWLPQQLPGRVVWGVGAALLASVATVALAGPMLVWAPLVQVVLTVVLGLSLGLSLGLGLYRRFWPSAREPEGWGCNDPGRAHVMDTGPAAGVRGGVGVRAVEGDDGSLSRGSSVDSGDGRASPVPMGH